MSPARVTREREAVSPLALEWITTDKKPHLLVFGTLEIWWGNPASHKILAAKRGLEARDGFLAATNGAYQDQLAGFVANTGSATSTLLLPCPDGVGHLIVRGREIAFYRDEPCIGLEFHWSEEFEYEYADFEVVFGLTRAEHNVLLALLAGRTADDVSREHKVGMATVRSHIRQIYGKLDVSSREGLIQRVRPYLL